MDVYLKGKLDVVCLVSLPSQWQGRIQGRGTGGHVSLAKPQKFLLQKKSSGGPQASMDQHAMTWLSISKVNFCRDLLCHREGPPCTEEALCVTEEARRVQKSPAVCRCTYRGGPPCTEEARCAQRRPAVHRAGPHYTEEPRRVQRRPSVT